MVAGASGRNERAIDMAPDPAARHFVSLVGRMTRFDATIEKNHGGYSSVAERLSVAQDVEGSIPSSRPNSPRSCYDPRQHQPWLQGPVDYHTRQDLTGIIG